MGLIKIIKAKEFYEKSDDLLEKNKNSLEQEETDKTVNEIITKIHSEGDEALWNFIRKYEKEISEKLEVPKEIAKEAWKKLEADEPALASSMSFAAGNIKRFAELQKEQFKDFEEEILPGIITGQRIIPVERAAIYIPGGRYPLISSALMGLITASVAGVDEKILVTPPSIGGLPHRMLLAAAYIGGADRIFSIGGAQAIAAFAYGTQSVPKADLIIGAGNKYVSAAKRLLYGEVGIDFIAGPSDLLIIFDKDFLSASNTDMMAEMADVIADDVNIIAADMLAQAEHDPDARARVLVSDINMAYLIEKALELRLKKLPTSDIARASLEAGGLIIVYHNKEEAVKIANIIAPEHLELHVAFPFEWVKGLRNYGSLFIGQSSGEILGDYSAGINNTLPTYGTSRFTGGLSVRNFLKTVTTLSTVRGEGYLKALQAAEQIALAEGLSAHAQSAAIRLDH